MMTAGDHAQGATIPIEWVEVDREFDEAKSAMIAATMPRRVADIKISIAAEIGKILTKNLSHQGM